MAGSEKGRAFGGQGVQAVRLGCGRRITVGFGLVIRLFTESHVCLLVVAVAPRVIRSRPRCLKQAVRRANRTRTSTARSCCELFWSKVPFALHQSFPRPRAR